MSVKIMSRVWNDSTAKGSQLLLLVAIADESKDNGCLYQVSTPDLAEKTRLTRRQVQRILRQLQRSGELQVHNPSRGGKNHRNQYRVNIRLRKGRNAGK